MAKIADIKLTWRKSPTADISRVVLKLTINGTETTADIAPSVEEFTLSVRANSTVTYALTVYDGEGLTAVSAAYTFVIGDLEAPLPATNLSHTIMAIRDEEPTPPPVEGRSRSR